MVQACDQFYPLGGDIVSVTVSVFGLWTAIGASDGSGGAGDNTHFVWRDVPSGKLLYDRAGLRVADASNECLHVHSMCVCIAHCRCHGDIRGLEITPLNE